MARILLAEDDLAVRDFIRMALEMDHHHVVAVYDGEEAIQRVQYDSGHYDLVLADIKMPLTDGLMLASQLVEEKADLPILFMTGFDDQKERALKLGSVVKGVLVKPFTLEFIREEVRKVLAA